MKILFSELENVWEANLSDELKSRGFDLRYSDLTPEENDYFQFYARKQLALPITKAGSARIGQWEDGWLENLKLLLRKKNADALIPLYYGKHELVRWRQKFIKPLNRNFEYFMQCIIQEWLFEKYFKDLDSIYEFGCGTGSNLFRARNVNKKAKLYGLDWAESSQEILAKVAEFGLLDNVFGHRFDLFNPDYSIRLDKNSGVFTSGALEQTGENFKEFIYYLLFMKPKVCINLEILTELLDKENPMDKICIDYAEKRNYLNGYVAYLKQLERNGKIVIHKIQRAYLGTLFIESPSVVVWSPK